LAWFTVLFIALFSLSGHYYLVNAIEFGNPLYPVKVGIFGIEFPGKDLSSTTLLANIDEQRVWDVFFPTSNISKGGIFFPMFMIFGLIGSLGILVYSLSKFVKTKKIESILLVISFFVFFTWSAFIVTPFSAEQVGEDLNFWVFSELHSTKYVIGIIFITELLFAYLLWKLKIPKIIIFSFFGINLISRYWILLTGIPEYFDYTLIIFPFIILVGLFFLGKFSKSIKPKIIVFSVLAVSVLIASPSMVEANRTDWVPGWHDVVFYLYELPPSEIFLIKEPKLEKGIWERTYPIYGQKFQHSIEIGTQRALEEKLEETSDPPEYVVKLCALNIRCDSVIEKLEMDLEPYGYEIAAIAKNGILLKFSD